MTTIHPRRSVLYMPASNARALEKAKTLNTDAMIFDLEDSVAPEIKEAARLQAVATAKGGGYGEREVAIRTNALTTEWGEADLKAAATAGADAILLPKVNTPDDIATARKLLQEAGAPAELPIWAMMETPFAIINAPSIAAEAKSPNNPLTAFIMGTNDLAKETRASVSGARTAMKSWFSTCVIAARAYGVDVIDGVFNNLDDHNGYRAECIQGRLLGMDGKTLIHPAQISTCNEIFSPTKEEIEWSRKLIAAFAAPENAGKGVLNVNGRMVERLHEEMAQRVVGIADAIAARKHAALQQNTAK
ncbi:MAG: CoA ester lyase [Alphaproteobacteria bacterium]